MEKYLKRISLSAGVGENLFTMKRGSFNYRQKVRNRRVFRQKAIRKTNNGYDVVYRRAGDEIIMAVERQGGFWRAHLKVKAKHPYNRFSFTFPAAPDAHYYGGGEVHSAFDLKGQRIRIFVAEHQNANRIGRKILRAGLTAGRSEKTYPVHKYESYYVQPTFVTSGKWFFHAETNNYCELDFRKTGEVTFHAQEPPVIWMGQADSFEEVSGDLTSILGRQCGLPDWVYDGAILAVQEGSEAVDRKIDAALNAGFEKVKINAVLIGGFNDDEIPQLAELTRQYPVDMRFIELMPMYDSGDAVTATGAIVSILVQDGDTVKRGDLLLETLDGTYDAYVMTGTSVKAEQDGGVAKLYRLPGAQGNIGLISPVSAHFCAECNRLRLTADGKLKPCLHSADEYSIKGLDDEQMREQFVAAILGKPRWHGELSAVQRSRAGRNMNQIGG